MAIKDIDRLLGGFRRFQQAYYGGRREPVDLLVREGQAPKVMGVACCESRVEPAIITECDPGDLFIASARSNGHSPASACGGG